MFIARPVLALAATCLAAASALAAPTVIDFEPGGVLLLTGQTYTEEQVRFTPTGSGDARIGPSSCDNGVAYCALGNTTSVLTGRSGAVVELQADQEFTLEGFDAAFVPAPEVNFFNAEIRLRIHATRWDGMATIDQDLELPRTPGSPGDYDFATHTLSAIYFSLRSVDFTLCGIGTSGFCEPLVGRERDQAHFALDNIRLDVAAPIPEPAPLVLLGAGLAGLLTSRRRTGR